MKKNDIWRELHGKMQETWHVPLPKVRFRFLGKGWVGVRVSLKEGEGGDDWPATGLAWGMALQARQRIDGVPQTWDSNITADS